jgi:outer membrane immunogenic protein
MRRVVVALGFVVVPGSVFAADLALKAPAAPVAYWTGIYVGAHVGGAWGQTSSTVTSTENNNPPTFPVGFGFSPNNFEPSLLGGVQIGANYQFGNWVAGVEGSFSGADISSQAASFSPTRPGFSTTSFVNHPWLALATGRLGYTPWSNLLVYGTGGAAWIRTESSGDTFNAASALIENSVGTFTQAGWTAGGGIEYKLDAKWSLLAQYNYIGLPTSNFSRVAVTGNNAGQVATRDTSGHFNVIKFGVNYKLY